MPAPSRTTRSRKRRGGAPIAGLAGFALAAGLAILIGVFLGGVPMPDGAAAGGETAGPTKAVPAATKAPDPESGGSGGKPSDKGKKNDNNGRGNGNDDDD